jgi:hypothetical protein
MALCVPAVPAGVWAGWRLHERLDQRALYRTCYAIPGLKKPALNPATKHGRNNSLTGRNHFGDFVQMS